MLRLPLAIEAPRGASAGRAATALLAGTLLIAWAPLAHGATKLNQWGAPLTYASASLLAVGQNEWFVGFSDGGVPRIARVNVHGQIVYGPVAPPAGFRGAGAWSGQAIGTAFIYGTQPSTYEIRFQLSDRDGNTISGPVIVSPPGLGPSRPLTLWANGEFAVEYCAETISSACVAIGLRRLSAAGTLASPEFTLIRDTTASLSYHGVARIGDRFFCTWVERDAASTSSLRGAWYDINGQPLTSIVAYHTAPSGDSVWPMGLIGRSDHVTLTYTRLPGGGLAEPPEQVHIDLAGSIIDGPRTIVEVDQATGSVSYTEEGTGLGFRHYIHGPGAYIRRVADDGIVGSPTSKLYGAPLGYFSVQDLAHQGRAYATVWLQPTSANPNLLDTWFEVAPTYEVFAAGAGPSPAAPPDVRILQPEAPSGPALTTIMAYASTSYGVNVGSAAITGDDVDRLLTGPGPGESYGPQVRAFDWRGSALGKVNFYAYATLRYGVKAGGGDLDGDVPHEILTAPGAGAVFGPHVRAFNFDNTSVSPIAKVSFYAYGTLRYGANAATGNIDSDATREILTGPGPGVGFGSHLRGFNYDNVAVTSISKVNAIVFPGSTHGLHVAAGDTEWDGFDEIATAAGPDPSASSRIAVYDYDGVALAEMAGSRFEAFAGMRGGARASFCQWDLDMRREILASGGPLPSSSSEVAAFDDASATFAPLTVFDPYPGQTHGTTLSAVHLGF